MAKQDSTGGNPTSKNKNGSSWVTARHGGDGNGNAGPGGSPSPVNHHGGVNPRTQAPKKDDDPRGQKPDPEDQADNYSDEDSEDDGPPRLHQYHEAVAADLRDNHGLTHNHAVRVAAGIVAKHAAGHAGVDGASQQAAAQAHSHWQNMLKKHKKASAVSAPQHAM